MPFSASSRRRPSRLRFSSTRSEEHTSELQSRLHLVCRLLLEKKNRAKHRHERRENVRVMGGAPGAENAFGFIDEQNRQQRFPPFLARRCETLAHDSLRFADPT